MINESAKNILINLGVNKDAIEKIANYATLLWSANNELNLFSRQMTEDELINNHIIDCVLPLEYFPKNLKTVADFGSGGGLPVVIYAILFPHTRFTAFEKSPKKQIFLNHCKSSLVPNLEIKGEIPSDFGGHDLVTARAFKPIDVILEVSRKYAQSNGKYFLLKGRRQKIDDEIQAAKKKFKNTQFSIVPLKSPVLDVERHLVKIN